MSDITPPVVVDRDPLACRTRWHAGPCVVETLSDGSKRHVTPGRDPSRGPAWREDDCYPATPTDDDIRSASRSRPPAPTRVDAGERQAIPPRCIGGSPCRP